eukprot:COSAG01_NODE_7978_length_2966_cov_7.303453_1_plen_92_part_00
MGRRAERANLVPGSSFMSAMPRAFLWTSATPPDCVKCVSGETRNVTGAPAVGTASWYRSSRSSRSNGIVLGGGGWLAAAAGYGAARGRPSD